MNNIKRILTVVSLLLLAACGSGGGGEGGETNGGDIQAAAPTAFTVVLQGEGAASVKGFQASITLPAGVALSADAAGRVASGVLTAATGAPSGYLAGKYTAAVAGLPATLELSYATLGDFAAGDVMVVDVLLAAEVFLPPASAYDVTSSKLVDDAGNPVAAASLSIR